MIARGTAYVLSLAAICTRQTRQVSRQSVAAYNKQRPRPLQAKVFDSGDQTPIPAGFGKAYREACLEYDLRAEDALWNGFVKLRQQPQLWMYEAKLSCYARKKDLPETISVFEELKASGRMPTQPMFNSILHAYSQAESAGEASGELPSALAIDAAALVEQMIEAGYQKKMGPLTFNWLIATQSKAGLLDHCIASYKRMQDLGIVPDSYTLFSLVRACSKAGQPLRAQEMFDTLYPKHGIQPHAPAWNALLKGYASAGHKDGAYAVWEQMQRAKVVPDQVTQRLLASAFGNNPGFATALVHEAKALQDGADLNAGGQSTENPSWKKLDLNNSLQLWEGQMQNPELAIKARGWHVLDLHGLSAPVAKIVLLNRLEYILGHPELVVDATASEIGLEIITGIGKHTWAGRTFVLRSTVLELLAAQNLQHQKGSNPGIVLVPTPVLQQYVQLQLRKSFINHFLKGASLRYLFVLCGIFGSVSAMHAVPVLLSQY